MLLIAKETGNIIPPPPPHKKKRKGNRKNSIVLYQIAKQIVRKEGS